MTREELEKRLEEVCSDHCDGCPLRKECEAYQAGEEKEEITAETLRAGMTFEGAASWNAGEWIRITAVDGNRVYMFGGDSCDREYFPGLNDKEWKYTGIDGNDSENAYLIA